MGENGEKILAVVVCDFRRAAIGTRSRLLEEFPNPGDTAVLARVMERLRAVVEVVEIVLLVPGDQMAEGLADAFVSPGVKLRELVPRAEAIGRRVAAARHWNLLAWRGGAGQCTAFDEEYHPAAIAEAAREAFAMAEKPGADHVLVVHSHAVFLDPALTTALIRHHLTKNHDMRVTYTPAAPGLTGMVLRADIVQEMGEKNVLPWQLLAYDPKAPAFDTLIRDACMQVDPALSKIPNRFCVDTERSWQVCRELAPLAARGESLAQICLAAGRTVAPGIASPRQTWSFPREIELELTGQRLTDPPGSVPEKIRASRRPLPAATWCAWLAGQQMPDDLLVTLGGDGDPLLYDGLVETLRAVRRAGVLSVALQTDLAGDIEPLLSAMAEKLVDVVTVTMYGRTAETYAQVARADLQAAVMKNMQRLAEATRSNGGMPLVIPRLLKVRQTIPEMESFFDFWIEACGWAVIDGPTDRAGQVPFEAVVDMAPPKRKPCRRLWERMVIRADGTAVACDQDIEGKLAAGNIQSGNVEQLWKNLSSLRAGHADSKWNEINPCSNCREWHRP